MFAARAAGDGPAVVEWISLQGSLGAQRRAGVGFTLAEADPLCPSAPPSPPVSMAGWL